MCKVCDEGKLVFSQQDVGSRLPLEMAVSTLLWHLIQAGNSECLTTKYRTLVTGTAGQGKCREMDRTESLCPGGLRHE